MTPPPARSSPSPSPFPSRPLALLATFVYSPLSVRQCHHFSPTLHPSSPSLTVRHSLRAPQLSSWRPSPHHRPSHTFSPSLTPLLVFLRPLFSRDPSPSCLSTSSFHIFLRSVTIAWPALSLPLGPDGIFTPPRLTFQRRFPKSSLYTPNYSID